MGCSISQTSNLSSIRLKNQQKDRNHNHIEASLNHKPIYAEENTKSAANLSKNLVN